MSYHARHGASLRRPVWLGKLATRKAGASGAAIAALMAPAFLVPGGGPAVARGVPAHHHVTVTAATRHHPHAPADRYVIREGDTLSSIARKEYGHANRWPALWWTNRHRVANPNAIRVGEWLILSEWHPLRASLTAKAMRHIPAPPPPPRAAPVVTPAYHAPAPAAPAQAVAAPAAPPAAPPAATYSGSGGFQSCVIARESGGNPSAVNASSGAGGLYQFLPSTWAALGFSGLPENASVAEQNAAFAKEYAQSGTSAWGPYDGC